ncbi:hypothetical protein PMAYCL1PPCAC_13145, partial [Pristionchus mayeri]
LHWTGTTLEGGDRSVASIICLRDDLQLFFEKTLQFYSGLQSESGAVDHTADLPEIPRSRKRSHIPLTVSIIDESEGR